MVEEHTCKGDRETESKLLNIFPYLMSDNNKEFKEEQSHDDDMVVSELDQEHYNGDPCPNEIDRILHPILNQDMLGNDIVSNLEIIYRFKLKYFPSHQIMRSIIPSMGENFQSTLLSQLFKSSCLGLGSNQAVIFEIFSQEFEHSHIMGENVFHFSSESSVLNNILQFINFYYGWLEKVYKYQFHLFSIFKQQMGLVSFTVLLHYNLPHLILQFYLE